MPEFSSWELGQIRDALADEARTHHSSPAVSALRAACVHHLIWNNYYRDCWADPTFAPRLQYLRTLILEGHTGLDTDFPVAAAVPIITALLDRIEAAEPDDEEVSFE
jgi:hypothetical protein